VSEARAGRQTWLNSWFSRVPWDGVEVPNELWGQASSAWRREG